MFLHFCTVIFNHRKENSKQLSVPSEKTSNFFIILCRADPQSARHPPFLWELFLFCSIIREFRKQTEQFITFFNMSQDNSQAKKTGLTGDFLKWIAIITMTIDHVAASVMYHALSNDFIIHPEYKSVYFIMRLIGRIAFPIYIFLITEGCRYTRNIWKYLARLSVFALISEIPFDMANNDSFFFPKDQNVFFTLALSVAAIAIMKEVDKKTEKPALRWVSYILLTAAASVAAFFLHTDYSFVGVLAICAAWLFRKNRIVAMLVTCSILLISSPSELFAFIAIWPIALYNGTKGSKHKYFFYFYYPAHLLIFGLIVVFLL